MNFGQFDTSEDQSYKQAVKVDAVRRTTARLFVFVPSIYAPGSSEDDLSTLSSIQVSQVL